MSKVGMQLSARDVSNLLAHIFGPAYYDGPQYDDHRTFRFGESVSARAFGREREVTLPPRAVHAMRLADAHIQEVLSLDAAGALLGGEAAKRALDRSVRIVDDLEELCPRWPSFPRALWPPPPPPPFQLGDVMTATELFLFGTRFLAAADLTRNENLQASLGKLGDKALTLGMQG